MVDVVVTRPELYKCFGPEMIHALVILVVEQLNMVRSFHELQQITIQQVETALQLKFDELTANLNPELPPS